MILPHADVLKLNNNLQSNLQLRRITLLLSIRSYLYLLLLSKFHAKIMNSLQT